MGGKPSTFKDYAETKRKVFSLKSYVEQYCEQKVLTHIDAVPDNFLFWEKNPEETDIRLIDWNMQQCRIRMWILRCFAFMLCITEHILIRQSMLILQRGVQKTSV